MYHLVDLYDGNTRATFDTTAELVAYLKEEDERGNLGGEGRYTIFKGQELSTVSFWEKALGKSVFAIKRED